MAESVRLVSSRYLLSKMSVAMPVAKVAPPLMRHSPPRPKVPRQSTVAGGSGSMDQGLGIELPSIIATSTPAASPAVTSMGVGVPSCPCTPQGSVESATTQLMEAVSAM